MNTELTMSLQYRNLENLNGLLGIDLFNEIITNGKVNENQDGFIEVEYCNNQLNDHVVSLFADMIFGLNQEIDFVISFKNEYTRSEYIKLEGDSSISIEQHNLIDLANQLPVYELEYVMNI